MTCRDCGLAEAEAETPYCPGCRVLAGLMHAPPPPGPTDAPPGTWAKVGVMELRAARRQQLHHPGDAR
jgi:hypothetical protein